MICRKCQNSFDDSMSKCPSCGTTVISGKANSEKFTVNIPELEIEDLSLDSELADSYKGRAAIIYNQQTEREQPEFLTEKPYIETTVIPPVDEAEAFVPLEYKSEIAEDVEAAKQRRMARVRKTPVNTREKDSIGDKFAASLIVLLVCILGVMMTALTVVSIKTDIFKSEVKDEIQTVALSGLSAEETVSLEQWLPKIGFAFEKDFKKEDMTVNEFLSCMKPNDSNGLYRTFYGAPEFVTETADPADYFGDEDYNYSYYKLPCENVDSLIELFGLTVNHTVNTDDFYYYDGNYYFKDKIEEGNKAVSYVVDVSSSKKLQDGSFYIKCSFYDSQNLGEPANERYAIVEKSLSQNSTESQWIIRQIGSEAIFNSSGVMITDTAKVNYEMATQTVEKKTSDGTVYHKYVIEYPIFSGESEGEMNANQLFSDLVNSYRTLGETSAQPEYDTYVQYGGKVEELPLITHIVTRVTYNENGYIGLVEETADYIPDSMPTEEYIQSQQEGQEEENEEEYYDDYYEDEYSDYDSDEQSDTVEEENGPVSLCQRTIEGYTFELESGDFITKDAFIGKDYQTLSKLLYRLYGNYVYEDLIYAFEKAAKEAAAAAEEAQAAATEATTQEDESTDEYYDSYDEYDEYDDYYYDEYEEYEEEQEEEDPYEYYTEENEIPEDENELGRAIYESASTLCKDGYLFCYVDSKGIARDVIIPYMPCIFLKTLGFEETQEAPAQEATTAAQETTAAQ